MPSTCDFPTKKVAFLLPRKISIQVGKQIIKFWHFSKVFSVAGDVVLREEPYAAVLEAIFRVNHCAYCLKKTATPIACYQCATVRYSSN